LVKEKSTQCTWGGDLSEKKRVKKKGGGRARGVQKHKERRLRKKRGTSKGNRLPSTPTNGANQGKRGDELSRKFKKPRHRRVGPLEKNLMPHQKEKKKGGVLPQKSCRQSWEKPHRNVSKKNTGEGGVGNNGPPPSRKSLGIKKSKAPHPTKGMGVKGGPKKDKSAKKKKEKKKKAHPPHKQE